LGVALGVSADETVLTAAQAEPVEQPNVVVNLDDASVSTAVCCPSRVTTLTGLYSHNHLVIRLEAPPSGYNRYVEQGHDQDNLATRL
jgi:hypothetical protein